MACWRWDHNSSALLTATAEGCCVRWISWSSRRKAGDCTPGRCATVRSEAGVLNPDGCGLRAGLIRELHSQGLRLALNVETAGAQLQISLVAQGLGLGLVPRAALAASPWRDEVATLALADFQPQVHLWLVNAQNLANLSQPLTFFAGKIVQQLNASD